MKIQLTDRQLAKIMRPVKGKGGFQTLLRRIQKQVSGNILTASNGRCRTIDPLLV